MAAIAEVSKNWSFFSGPDKSPITSVLIRTPEASSGFAWNKLVAIFSLDKTLIKPKFMGEVYRDDKDWELAFPNIPKKLQKLHNKGVTLMIVDNQHIDDTVPKVYEILKTEMQARVDAFLKLVNVPMFVFISLKPDSFQKPYTRSFDYINQLYQANNIVIDKANSVVVGANGGRTKQKGRDEKDDSIVDRYFATNIGISYNYPERAFDNNKTEYLWKHPLNHLSIEQKIDFLNMIKPPAPKITNSVQQMYILIGPPRSAKTLTAKNFCEFWNQKLVPKGKSSMKIVKQETIRKGYWGTIEACLDETKLILHQGHSVVIDADLPDNETRSKFVELAQPKNAPGDHIRVEFIEIMVSKEFCKHINNFTCAAYFGANFEPKVLLPEKYYIKYWKLYQSAEMFVKHQVTSGNQNLGYQKVLYLFPQQDKKEIFKQDFV